MAGRLTTHVIDTAQGRPAALMTIELWLVNPHGGDRTFLKAVRTNAQGRTDEPLLVDSELKSGHYELIFAVGDYFAKQEVAKSEQPFLGEVPVRFGIADATSHYHIPLLVSPWSYSTYRGS